MHEFGPLNLVPNPSRQWAERGGKLEDPAREPRRRRRATYNRYGGVRHLFAALDLARDKLYGYIKPIKKRTQFLEFCRYLRTLYPAQVRIAVVCDNFSPHLTTRKSAARRRPGHREQRRDRLHADEQRPAQPHRSPVRRPALLHPRRHRPHHPQGAGQHDPPLRHLAKPPRRRPTPTGGRRQGERCLTQHQPGGTGSSEEPVADTSTRELLPAHGAARALGGHTPPGERRSRRCGPRTRGRPGHSVPFRPIGQGFRGACPLVRVCVTVHRGESGSLPVRR